MTDFFSKIPPAVLLPTIAVERLAKHRIERLATDFTRVDSLQFILNAFKSVLFDSART